MVKTPETPNGEGRFLTKKEVAALLHFSVSTIDTWVSQRREIPFIKIGGRVRFDRRDIEKWVVSKKVQPRDLNS